MRRRTFLLAGGLVPSVTQVDSSRAGGGPERQGDIPFRLAGMTLPELRARYHRELFEVVLPFWEAYGVDHEHGGFICALDDQGRRLNTDKLLVFQGRGLWVWSTLFQQFGRSERHLEVARGTYRFCLDHLRRPDGSWRLQVAGDGRVENEADADPSALICLAEGLHAYGVATGDARSEDLGRAVLFDAVARGTAPGRPSRQGLWFFTLLVCTGMLRHRPDAELERLARRAVDALVSRHHNPETGLHDEVLTPELERSPAEAGFTVFGHSVEGLWMLMDHAVRIGDETLFDTLASRLQHHLDVGWDRIHGGLAHAVRVDQGGYVWPVERPLGTIVEFRAIGEYHYMKSFWSLAEVLVATLKVLERRPAPWAAEYFRLAQRVLDDRLSLAPLGHPLYTLFTDRRLTRGIRTGRAENYHHPRMLMLNLLALDRMIARQRAPA